MKVLSDSNFIIRKVGTFKTQCVHRKRLKIFKPEFPVQDVDIGSQPVYADMERTEYSDILESNNPKQKNTNPEQNETGTDEETPVEQIIRLESPDHRLAIKRHRHPNRLPNRLSLTPHPEKTLDNIPQSASRCHKRKR